MVEIQVDVSREGQQGAKSGPNSIVTHIIVKMPCGS